MNRNDNWRIWIFGSDSIFVYISIWYLIFIFIDIYTLFKYSIINYNFLNLNYLNKVVNIYQTHKSLYLII